MALTPEDRVMVMAPIVRGRKGEFKKEMETLVKHGYTRARIDGELVGLDDEVAINLDKRKNHTIEVVIDRLLVKPGIEHRLEMSVALAMKLAGGLVQVAVVGGEEQLYSEKLACPDCGISVPQLEPRSFSFNSMYGACPECHGLGSKYDFDPAKVIHRLVEAAARWRAGAGIGVAESDSYAADFGGGLWHQSRIRRSRSFPRRRRTFLLNGEPGRGGKTGFHGIFGYLKQNLEESTSEGYRDWLMDHMSATECPACHGKRLAAGEPGGQGKRDVDCRIHSHAGGALAGGSAGHQAGGARGARLPGASCTKWWSGCSSWMRWGWDTSRWIARRQLCREAKGSAFGWRRRLDRSCAACCMCSTSRRSDCIIAITDGC